MDNNPDLRAFSYPPTHPTMALWLDDRTGFIPRLRRWIAQQRVHPGKTLVLLPYAQLLPLVRRIWGQHVPHGFIPRFETTTNWLSTLGEYVAQSVDISHDLALDVLNAQHLMARSGVPASADLAKLLAETAQQLAPSAAAAGPQGRSAWAENARRIVSVGMESPALAWEAQVLRIAVEWAAVSTYATDALFAPHVAQDWDAIAWVQGISHDPVAAALHTRWEGRARIFTLDVQDDGVLAEPSTHTDTHNVQLHECTDAADEAQRAAACAMAHVAANRYPVALVSSDRALTRRVRAMLESAGIAMRDENGWKLSTSRVGAVVMGLLRASDWNASTDAVLGAFKLTPQFAQRIESLESVVRRQSLRDWRQVTPSGLVRSTIDLQSLCKEIDAVRGLLARAGTLLQCLENLQLSLQRCGLWELMLSDEAGVVLLAALRLQPTQPQVWSDYAQAALWAHTRMQLSDFNAWVGNVLEAHSFQPAYPEEEQVVILPMSQMLGRPFAAVILAGCDEIRLNPSPEPVGLWTPQQREALGMPLRATLEDGLRTAWQLALRAPVCDVLWRSSDDSGESIAPSALVQSLMLQQSGQALAADPRLWRSLDYAGTARPAPNGQRLPVEHLSASAYDDMRTCPYRFFALRQLGLQPVAELESEVDKRDFGVWLHAVLERFHAAMRSEESTDEVARIACLQAAADAVSADMALPEEEFLPFLAAWPQVRDGYLAWLQRHESQGWCFATGETSHTQWVDTSKLVGRLDRTDHHSSNAGEVMVLDYKTEALEKTKARLKNSLEDTQIAFYAALLPHDRVRAAYVHVGERDGTVLLEQPDVVHARDALIDGIRHDMQRTAQGHALLALGDGAACDYCQARGLCRKDFWDAA